MGNSLHLSLEDFPCVGKNLCSVTLEDRFCSSFKYGKSCYFSVNCWH